MTCKADQDRARELSIFGEIWLVKVIKHECASPHLWNRLPSDFIPSTSLCSLSSWFTSSCAYHLIRVINFVLTIYYCLDLSLQT